MLLLKATSFISGSTSNVRAGHLHRLILWLSAALLLSACDAEQPRATNSGPRDPALNTAELPIGINLPPGFSATVFADDVGTVRHLAIRANGDVYAMTRNTARPVNPETGTGGIVALRDNNDDGAADEFAYFGRGDTHTGIAIHDNHVYYSSAQAVYAVALDQNLAPQGPSEIVVDGFGDSGFGHSAKPVTFDDDGHMYLQAGVPSNACQEQDRAKGSPGRMPCPELEEFGGIWRFIANNRGQTLWDDGIRISTGIRNAVALEWNTLSDELFLVMHGRDSLDTTFPQHYTSEQRQELPAEEFHVITSRGDLGWPYTYYDPLREQRMLAPEYGGDGETPAETGRYQDPLIGFPAHWAPNDLLFYTANQFPEQYHGGAFIAFHGSWNREPGIQQGYSVVFVPMRDGRPAGDWEVFADGFEGREPVTSPASAVHRPTGLALGPDGSLYISDDAGGRIWKVSYSDE